MTRMSEQEEIEMISRWWKDYGKSIVLAVIIGLLFGFGWRYWNLSHVKRGEQASMIYQGMTFAAAAKDQATTQRLATLLQTKYSGTPYATFAALTLAQNNVAQNDYNAALEQLQWVVQKGNVASLREIARLRAARILLAQNKFDPALNLLTAVDDPSFSPLAAAITGDIYAAKGDVNAAQKSYQIAQAGFNSAGVQDPMLAMKLAQ